jgi:ribosomal protein S18 acetylase RimI-like enzyme
MPESESYKKKYNLKIRPMEIDDLAQVFHLGERLFTARAFPNMYRTWDEYEVVGLFQSDSEFCFVAEADEQLAGFALGTVISKTSSAWKYGYLIWMGVDPVHSRQGIAERLLRHFREAMLEEGARMLIVDTEADNLPALRFFRKMGFGNPQEHIYLSMNLSARQAVVPEKKGGGIDRRQIGKPR